MFLKIDYNVWDSVYNFIRKLFALPFLPEEQIPVTFNALKKTSPATDNKSSSTTWIQRTWMSADIGKLYTAWQ